MGRECNVPLGREVETYSRRKETGGAFPSQKVQKSSTTPYPVVETYPLPLSLLSLYPPIYHSCISTPLTFNSQEAQEGW
jgi:hypothetical protein